MPRRSNPPGQPTNDPLERLQDSAKQGKLVAVIGTGFSIAVTSNSLPTLGWKGLIKHGFEHGARLGKITSAQVTAYQAHLDSNDIDDLIVAAEFMGRKLGAPRGDLYTRWFRDAIAPAAPTHTTTMRAFKRITDAGVPICTLNYDHLLEQVTGLPTITMLDTHRVLQFSRREAPGILHLHGSYEQPDTCVLTCRDYAATIGDAVRDLIQRSLAAFNRLLFIGCGGTFADPNFRALVPWLREHLGANTDQHYTLVRTAEVTGVHADPDCQGFVEPIAYGTKHENLPQFLKKLFPTKRPPARAIAAPPPTSTAAHAAILQAYRKYLLDDCGETTIEGMRGVADTAQGRFDLERVFVPMRLIPADPSQRDESEVSSGPPPPRPFAEVFGETRRLALLALPGGGKTMLLKRLAVAYADPQRRGKSSDQLPDIDLIPVLIRCRDWRDRIDRPLFALFDDIASLTGHRELEELGEALLPRLELGSVLLLVDGLNEIHDAVQRSSFIGNLCEFLSKYDRVRIVITSREAGFDLVADDVATVCQRFRVAALDKPAIDLLARHWHTLTTDDSPQSLVEASHFVDTILQSEALGRLAENPLLLTMLLVVKHGSGGLPLDRLTLYERAVDVLLNTWNNRGHAPLGWDETVPTLAYIARQMLLKGKKTASESELLELIQAARDTVPSIHLYASTSPLLFLRSVELRSSLLLEGGKTVEHGRPVPLYQFRHLTFQEYLAAVAIYEGYYFGFQTNDTILTTLAENLLADDWKEVVPMAATLAKRRAQPLIAELLNKASYLQAEVERGNFDINDWSNIPRSFPSPVARLLRCLVEGAEAEPQTINSALRTIAFFASGALLVHDFTALCRGPYGDDILRQAVEMASTMRWPEVTKMHFTCARIAVARAEREYWLSTSGLNKISDLLRADDLYDVARGLYTVAGLLWNVPSTIRTKGGMAVRNQLHLGLLEHHLLRHDRLLAMPAVFAWRLASSPLVADDPATYTTPQVLDKLMRLWLDAEHGALIDESASALYLRLGHPRGHWNPALEDIDIERIQARINNNDPLRSKLTQTGASLLIAFHARLSPDTDLAHNITTRLGVLPPGNRNNVVAMLRQLGPVGQRLARSLQPSTVSRS